MFDFSTDHFEDLAAQRGADEPSIDSGEDAQGGIWAGAQNEIARWRGDGFEDLTPTNGERVFDPSLVFPTRSGALWVLTGDRCANRLAGNGWRRRWNGRDCWDAAAGHAMGAHEDRDGGVWFNHYGNGLFHVAPDGRLQHFTTKNGLPGDRVEAWYQGREGGVWLGIDRGGLTRLRDRRFQVIGLSEGLPAAGRVVGLPKPGRRGVDWDGGRRIVPLERRGP